MGAELAELITTIGLPLFGILCSVLIFLLKQQVKRVQKLEEQQRDLISREDVRIMINEKIDPIRQQIAVIDAKLDKIIQIILTQKISR